MTNREFHKKRIFEWLNEEYVEPCQFKKDELVEVSDDGIEWYLRYFYRIDETRTNRKFLTSACGKTSKEIDLVTGWKYCRKYGTLGGLVKE